LEINEEKKKKKKKKGVGIVVVGNYVIDMFLP